MELLDPAFGRIIELDEHVAVCTIPMARTAVERARVPRPPRSGRPAPFPALTAR